MRRQALVVAVAVLGLSACLGQRSSTLDAIEGSVVGAWVEAFIEYGGPQDKWAGPAPFILHIDARENTTAQVAMTPTVFQETDYSPMILGGGRMPASTPDLGSTRVRERLAAFVHDLEKEPEPVRGCLSPLRVRLVSGTGRILEKQGCRGTQGWAKSASQLVADFMAAAAQAQADREAALDAQRTEDVGK